METTIIILIGIITLACIYFIINTPLTTHKKVQNYFIRNTSYPKLLSTGGTNRKKDLWFDSLITKRFPATYLETVLMQKAQKRLCLDENSLFDARFFHLEDYYFDPEIIRNQVSRYTPPPRNSKWVMQKKEDEILIGIGYDRKLRSSAYQTTLFFCTDKQIHIYEELHFLHINKTVETIKTFPWKSISAISSVQNTLDIKGETIARDCLKISSPGNDYTCMMKSNDCSNSVIKTMQILWLNAN
jgi:hypothetical protein